MAGRGRVGPGPVRNGEARSMARLGGVRYGLVRLGIVLHGTVRRSQVWHGSIRLGKDRGKVRFGKARHSGARFMEKPK